jgi:hypothetical protein
VTWQEDAKAALIAAYARLVAAHKLYRNVAQKRPPTADARAPATWRSPPPGYIISAMPTEQADLARQVYIPTPGRDAANWINTPRDSWDYVGQTPPRTPRQAVAWVATMDRATAWLTARTAGIQRAQAEVLRQQHAAVRALAALAAEQRLADKA